MRIFLAAFITETNTFSPMPTTKEDFEESCFHRFVPDASDSYWEAPLLQFAHLAEQKGWNCFKSVCAVAEASGIVVQGVYEEIRNTIIADLKQHGPFNAVFLHLHGAMISQKNDDCERDILRRVREVVGPKAVISALLDPHTHLTKLMEQSSDILVWMKEYPHTDIAERTDEVFSLVEKTLAGEVKPTTASFDCHAINMLPTHTSTMRNFIHKIQKVEKTDPKVLSISPVHGFPWADMPDMGSRLLVIADNDLPYAKKISEQLGMEFTEIVKQTKIPMITVNEAMELCRKLKGSQPLVLADFADNTGGGAPGDSTFILEALLKNKINHFALSSIWDPFVVKMAMAVGEGNDLTIRLGGKIGPQSGNPIDLTVTVKKIITHMSISFAGATIEFGNSIALSIKGLEQADLVVNDVRCQTYSTECFTNLGIEPSRKKILIVKSSQQFRGSFMKISDDIHVVATPGALNPDFKTIPYKNIKRKIFPIS